MNMGSLRCRLRGLIFRTVDDDRDTYTTPPSSSSNSIKTEEAQTESDTSSKQEYCSTPFQTDEDEDDDDDYQDFFFPQDRTTREDESQRPPSYNSAVLAPNPHDTLAKPPPPPASPPPGMDPLAAAAWHNKTQSPMYRLPDSVLAQIIDRLDNSGVESMRRMARRFPPVCADIIDDRPGAYTPDDYGRGEPCLVSMCPAGQAQELLRVAEDREGLPADRSRLVRLLDRDRYCDGCRAARAAPD